MPGPREFTVDEKRTQAQNRAFLASVRLRKANEELAEAEAEFDAAYKAVEDSD